MNASMVKKVAVARKLAQTTQRLPFHMHARLHDVDQPKAGQSTTFVSDD